MADSSWWDTTYRGAPPPEKPVSATEDSRIAVHRGKEGYLYGVESFDRDIQVDRDVVNPTPSVLTVAVAAIVTPDMLQCQHDGRNLRRYRGPNESCVSCTDNPERTVSKTSGNISSNTRLHTGPLISIWPIMTWNKLAWNERQPLLCLGQ